MNTEKLVYLKIFGVTAGAIALLTLVIIGLEIALT